MPSYKETPFLGQTSKTHDFSFFHDQLLMPMRKQVRVRVLFNVIVSHHVPVYLSLEHPIVFFKFGLVFIIEVH